jgi:1-acyl-sn-glycerol-3-phosphate acyltransferase
MIRVRREARRLARGARLLAHLAIGILMTYPVFFLIEVTGFDRQRHRREALVRAWMRGLLRILNVNLRVRGNIQPGAALYCANHVSWLDIPCLRAIVDAAFVAKSEVRRWPLVGGLAARAGTLFLRRGNHGTTSRIAERMTWLLAAGRTVIIFPEGTSTDGSSVLRFHARLFQAATRIDGHVQAVAIRYPRGKGIHPGIPFIGDDDLASHLWRLLGEESIEAELHFCTPLATAGRERRALADTTRRQIIESLEYDTDVTLSASDHKQKIHG